MGQISFTTDIWSDQNLQPYLAITAHWITKLEGTSALQLKASLIAFHRLHGSHDGESLAGTVLKLLDRAGITVKVRLLCLSGKHCISEVFLKVGHFTVDNAANNETMMKGLEWRLAERDIDFDAAERKIMCYGHVVDLSSGRVIRGVTDAVDYGDDFHPNPAVLTHDEAAESTNDPIVLARAVVRAVRGSGLRRDAFNEVIMNGNAKGWFKRGDPAQTVVLKRQQLLRDVRTRWDSVYHMLNRLRDMRPVWVAALHFIKFLIAQFM